MRGTLRIGRVATSAAEAASEVFAAMLDVSVEVGAPFVDPSPLLKSDVIGVVGLEGDVSGCVSLHCSQDQSLEFARRLLKLESRNSTGSEDVRDAIAELVNMIAGRLKASLEGDLWLQTALPVVALTPKLGMTLENSSGIAVPLNDGSGEFYVELTVTGAIDC